MHANSLNPRRSLSTLMLFYSSGLAGLYLGTEAPARTPDGTVFSFLSEIEILLCPCSRQLLSSQCSAQLFDEEVDMAESIDFQIPMKTACSREIKLYCENVPHGHARVIRQGLLNPLSFKNGLVGCLLAKFASVIDPMQPIISPIDMRMYACASAGHCPCA